ncbi:hypothetical protein P7C73_g2983, partial [Tremellales sp. Uapishka_1]
MPLPTLVTPPMRSTPLPSTTSPSQSDPFASETFSVASQAGSAVLTSPTSLRSYLPLGPGGPPYTAPKNVSYPAGSYPNPHVGDMRLQPTFEPIPAGTLYRPALLPADVDVRLDLTSVWMGVEKQDHKAVYFLPPTCRCCNQPSVAQHCDRGWPKCARCVVRGIECIPGSSWGTMKPKAKRRNLKAEALQEISKLRASREAEMQNLPQTVEETMDDSERYTAEEKGKGRADVVDSEGDGAENGRGKRVKKKRRFSSAEDPLLSSPPYSPAGPIPKKARSSEDPPLDMVDPPLDIVDPLPTLEPSVPSLNADDVRYHERILQNAERPPLTNMKHPCPVWSRTRKALLSSVEYCRNPIKIPGGSVDVGLGGMARSVILEGESVGETFWGTGSMAGTIVTSLGPARKRRCPAVVKTEPQNQAPLPSPTFVYPLSPPLNLLPSVLHVERDVADPALTVAVEQPVPIAETVVCKKVASCETPEIEALLRTQQSRTPIAVVVTQDYSAAPWKVPRPFIVLGWFWVTDAWVEPIAGGDNEVGWKFRFDWCGGLQGKPWWPHTSLPDRRIRGEDLVSAEYTWSLGGSGASTVREDVSEIKDGYFCLECGYLSARVYKYGPNVCLNEPCEFYFMDVPDTMYPRSHMSEIVPFVASHDLINTSIRHMQRVLPEHLGLMLRSPEPKVLGDHMSRTQLGREFWKGWVCRKCGMANERRYWSCWDCEGCKHYVAPKRKILSAESLRPSSRPIYTGPRQDDGFPDFPYETTLSSQIWRDDLKIVKHGLEVPFGTGTEVLHALSHQGGKLHLKADEILKDMQSQSMEVPLRRYTVKSDSRRDAEKCLSSYYTSLAGPEGHKAVENAPTGASITWKDSHDVMLKTINLMNERAGRMFPGHQEFNSLLVLGHPNIVPPGTQAKITLEPHAHLVLLFLGSDGELRLRNTPGHQRVKLGGVTAQHGDVIGVKSGPRAIELLPKLDGFGFICIGRQVYDAFLPISNTVPATETGTKKKAAPKPPKLPPPSLAPWYIGCYPIDQDRPQLEQPLGHPESPVVNPLLTRAMLDSKWDSIDEVLKRPQGVEEGKKVGTVKRLITANHARKSLGSTPAASEASGTSDDKKGKKRGRKSVA